MRVKKGYRDQAALVNWYYLEFGEKCTKEHFRSGINNMVPKTLYMLILEKSCKGSVQLWEKWYQCLTKEKNTEDTSNEIYQKDNEWIVIEENYNDAEAQMNECLPVVTGFLMYNLKTTPLEMAITKLVAYYVFGLDEQSEANKKYFDGLVEELKGLTEENANYKGMIKDYQLMIKREFPEFYEKFTMNISKEINVVIEKMVI